MRSTPATRTPRPRRRRPRRRPPTVFSRVRSYVLAVLILVGLGFAGFGLARAAGLLPRGLDLSVLATWGTIENKVDCRAFVVRRESLVAAPVTGTVRAQVAEGERVRPGQVIAEIVDMAGARDVEAQLIDLDRKIAAAQQAAQGADAPDPRAAARARESYRVALAGLGQVVLSGRTSAFAGAWDELAGAARARAAADKRVAGKEQSLQELLDQRAGLLARLESSGTAIESEEQALVTFALDGLEDRTVEEILRTGPADFLRWREDMQSLAAGTRVGAGDPVCKLVDPSGGWLAMILPAGSLSGASPGDTVAARFPGLGEAMVRGTIEHLGPVQKDGTRMVVVATEGILAGLARGRWFETELLLMSRSGVIVPRAVIVKRDGQDGVYILSRTSAYFRPVTVLASAGGDVMVHGVNAGTAVARFPWLWSLLGRVR